MFLETQKLIWAIQKSYCFHDNLSHVLNGHNTHSQSYLSQ